MFIEDFNIIIHPQIEYQFFLFIMFFGKSLKVKQKLTERNGSPFSTYFVCISFIRFSSRTTLENHALIEQHFAKNTSN